MNSFFSIFSSFSFFIFFLWILLFVFLFFKISKDKLSFNYKLLNIEKKSGFSSVTYKKTLYLLLLMFLLTQFLPWSITINNSLLIDRNYEFKIHDKILYYFISIFTLLTFYFFIFSFFLIINSNKIKKKCTWQFISFSLLFLNSFFNLITIPNQALSLWHNVNILSFIVFILLYILVLRLFLKLFKYFFNYSIKQVVKLTIFIFDYQGIKTVFINSENKINILTFFKQLWSMLLLINENKEEYSLLINTTAEIINLSLLTINASIVDDKVTKINIKFIDKNKKVFFQDKTLKDYIFINGWKMSLIQ